MKPPEGLSPTHGRQNHTFHGSGVFYLLRHDRVRISALRRSCCVLYGARSRGLSIGSQSSRDKRAAYGGNVGLFVIRADRLIIKRNLVINRAGEYLSLRGAKASASSRSTSM
jgi:hypothetical protein